MTIKKPDQYGAVYTPSKLANFTISLLDYFSAKNGSVIQCLLDPACGEGALLNAAQKTWGETTKYIGIDRDKAALTKVDTSIQTFNEDAILPTNAHFCYSSSYWSEKLPKIDAVIANPPWSSEKIYSKEKLLAAGYSLNVGQYDSYILFIELALSIVVSGGYIALILPDSIFDTQNRLLRKFLSQNTKILSISRLGEKIFDDVNRATSIIILQKLQPDNNSLTECFRLTSDERKAYLKNSYNLYNLYLDKHHTVSQSRFCLNENYNFNIDTKDSEEELLGKIREKSIDLSNYLHFGRGVEISKSGKIVCCNSCNFWQGYTKEHLKNRYKKCVNCGQSINFSDRNTDDIIAKKKFLDTKRIFVGENIHRYVINGSFYIKLNVNGINYKSPDVYKSPKILVRKTGLGLYFTIDYSNSLTNQTVYILHKISNNDITPLEYYVALFNSRVIYYYYLKMYGENEWKSHPYITKNILLSLPIIKYEYNEITSEIVNLSKKLIIEYNRNLDIQLENYIFKLYNITDDEKYIIYNEINSLPDLSSINNMKVEI